MPKCYDGAAVPVGDYTRFRVAPQIYTPSQRRDPLLVDQTTRRPVSKTFAAPALAVGASSATPTAATTSALTIDQIIIAGAVMETSPIIIIDQDVANAFSGAIKIVPVKAAIAAASYNYIPNISVESADTKNLDLAIADIDLNKGGTCSWSAMADGKRSATVALNGMITTNDPGANLIWSMVSVRDSRVYGFYYRADGRVLEGWWKASQASTASDKEAGVTENFSLQLDGDPTIFTKLSTDLRP